MTKRASAFAAFLLGVLSVACGSAHDEPGVTWPLMLTKEECNLPDKTDKEKGICALDADCQYVWYTGGCYTPEYVGRTHKEAACDGRLIGGERPLREGVTCTCEKSACVTHN
jgi:hypothetical protein